MRYRGVLFDMDGLLLDSEQLVVTCFAQTAQEFSLPDLSHVVLKMIGLRSDVSDNILDRALRDHMDPDVFSASWDRRCCEMFDKGIPLKSGVTDLLQQISAIGLPCAVATSTQTKNAHRHLENAGLARFFQTVIGGDQVSAAKPSPDIYHRAAASIGLAAKDCAAFEDSDPGATAAFCSGAQTVQVPDINAPAAEMLDLGHVIAPSLLAGARMIELIPTE